MGETYKVTAISANDAYHDNAELIAGTLVSAYKGAPYIRPNKDGRYTPPYKWFAGNFMIKTGPREGQVYYFFEIELELLSNQVASRWEGIEF